MSRKAPYGRGWKPVTKYLIGLQKPECVQRWGYEVDRKIVLERLRKEALKLMEEETLGRPLDLNEHVMIAQHHPTFSSVREALKTIRGAIVSVSGEGVMPEIFHELVEAHIQNVVAKCKRTGQQRKLWMETIGGSEGGEGWRGPWRVLAKRIVKTGTYEAASGGGRDYFGEQDDYEPACLCNQKAHVLLLAEHWDDREGKWLGEITVERTNTFPWECEQAAQKLMEEPKAVKMVKATP